jgi:DNA-binding MarR family transcriptional regulator
VNVAESVSSLLETPIDDTPIDVDRLRLVLLRLARKIRTSSVEEITPSQLAVLATVSRSERATIGQIAESEHVKPPSVSKIVAALEAAGFLARETDPDDRRCAFITVTGAGAAYLDEVRAAGRTWLASQLADLGADDLGAIASVLPVLEHLLEVGE